jgi:hypothetical protein
MPSVVDLYASETRFKTAQNEYNTLMKSLNHSCLGKYKSTTECLRAAQLNADMQAELIKMSNLMLEVNPATDGQPTVLAQQQKLLALSDELSADYATLTADPKHVGDAEVIVNMQQSRMLAWAFVAVVVTAALLKM